MVIVTVKEGSKQEYKRVSEIVLASVDIEFEQVLNHTFLVVGKKNLCILR